MKDMKVRIELKTGHPPIKKTRPIPFYSREHIEKQLID